MIKPDAIRPFAWQFEMAFFAQVAGRQTLIMLAALATGAGVVVTTNAVVEDRGVIHSRGGLPRQGGMAHTAIGSRCDVPDVLAGCNNTIVTAAAQCRGLCVVNASHWPPHGIHMAGFAQCAGEWVCCGLSGASAQAGSVMTSAAGRGRLDLRVIERGCSPQHRFGFVAGLAQVVGVQALVMFAALSGHSSEGTAMAGDAVTGQRGVIDGNRRSPTCSRSMANIACLCRRNMRCTFTGACAQPRTVMAGGARRRRLNLAVVEGECRCPRRRFGAVARLAQVTGVQSVVVFAALPDSPGQRAAMAGHAVAGQRRVIHRHIRFEPGGLRCMTGVAGKYRRDVRRAFAGFS